MPHICSCLSTELALHVSMDHAKVFGTILQPELAAGYQAGLHVMCEYVECRVEGLKRVSKACVGEKHSLALQSWCHSPKQLRLPILAAAAALPSESTPHPNADAEDFAELAAQAGEDAEWTAAADRSVGSAVASTAAASAVPCQGNAEGVGVSGDWGRGEGTGGKWLGRDFWVGLETAHQKIQAARAQAE